MSSGYTETQVRNTGEADALALDILTLSRNRLLIRLRFLSSAFIELALCPDPEGTIGTDGLFIYYSTPEIIRRAQISQDRVTYDYLHMVFHCLFHHPFTGPSVDRTAWDTAADIAVCAAILELDLPYVRTGREEKQLEMIKALRTDTGSPVLTAEKLYHYFREIHCETERLMTLRDLFLSDDHERWYTHSVRPSEDEEDKVPDSESDPDSPDESDSAAPESGDEEKGEAKPANGDSGEAPEGSLSFDEANSVSPSDKDPSSTWKDIAGRVKTDLETFSREYGDKAGSLMRSLSEVTRERRDYGEFLRQFSVRTEVLKTSDEEFDYIYYTYGLSLYGRIPLIEPLEYSEQLRVRDFVIVIDTSGSVAGKPVRTFLQKTWDILKSTESFDHTVNIHIILCDAEVQGDTKLTTLEEADHFIQTLTLKGFGGTDFRPAFRYIDQLADQHEFTDLQGVIYFTDGDGIYPEMQPHYKTAFVFPEDNYNDQNVPLWAMKHVLCTEEEDS